MSYNKIKTDFQVGLAKWLARRSINSLMRLGGIVGKLFYYLPNSRKKVARININLCFPELNGHQSKALLRDNLVATGKGVMEMLAALWAPDDHVEGRFTIAGIEHLQKVMNDGSGCLLLSCHTTSIEWGIRGLNHHLKALGMPVGHMLARQHNNKMLEAHFEQARLSFVEKLIDKKNLRSLLKSIQGGHPVYYAPDQNFSYQVAFADFFGRPAATTLGTQKLAKKGVAVVPWFCFRVGKGHWRIELLPAIEDMAELTDQVACQTVNQLFEDQIRLHPEQYLWVHRRFKNQPEGFENPYQ